ATSSCGFSHSTIPITSDSSHSETLREVVFAPILGTLELRPAQTPNENRHQLSLDHYTEPLRRNTSSRSAETSTDASASDARRSRGAAFSPHLADSQNGTLRSAERSVSHLEQPTTPK